MEESRIDPSTQTATLSVLKRFLTPQRRGPRVGRSFIGSSLLFVLCCVQHAEGADLPSLFPDIRDTGVRPLQVTASELSDFEQYLLPQVAEEVRAGRLQLSVAAQLRVGLRLDDAWEQSTGYGRSSLSESGQLQTLPVLQRGWPFGSPQSLAARRTAVTYPREVLLASAALWWSAAYADLDFAIATYSKGSEYSRIHGRSQRAFWPLLPATTVPQLFRELVTFDRPGFLQGLRWLTFRPLANNEDTLWMSSPALRQVVQLTSSNRGDPIARSAFSLEDLFVWSGKLDDVDPTVIGERDLLVPFTRPDPLPIVAESSQCAYVLPPVDDTIRVSSSSSTSDAVLIPSWSPLHRDSIHVPRSLLILELRPRDPFSRHGRQQLFLDQESFLPIMKVVYDRTGELWKTVLGVHGIAATPDRAEKRFFLSQIVVYDHMHSRLSILSVERHRSCSQFPNDAGIVDLDPGSLIQPPVEDAVHAPKEDQDA